MIVTKEQAERKKLLNIFKEDPAKHYPTKELEEVMDHPLFCECHLCKQYWNGIAQTEQTRRTVGNNYVDDSIEKE